jgi:hypothetical protein
MCYFGNYNLELTIAYKGWVWFRCELGLGAGLVQGVILSRISESVYLCLILRPVTLPLFQCTLCTFILGEVVAGRSHCHVWLVAQDVMGLLYGFS